MNGAVYSMTGFATGTLTTGANLDISLDIRSVNSRFLDISFKLPDNYRYLEPKLRDIASRLMKRGKCEIKLSVQSKHEATELAHELNPDRITHLLAQQTRIQALAPHAAALSVAEILGLIAKNNEASADARPSDTALLALMQTTMNDFVQARRVEGGKLAGVMLDQVRNLREQRTAVIPLIPALIEQQRQKFIQRLNDAVADSGGRISASVAEERALTEATAFALRIDVTEEVNRLGSHLDEIESLLTKGSDSKNTELGKRLEFLIQELQREANTLGSKSATLESSRIAIEMKVLIEQLREQVQNIE
ncbi:MAG: YicC/YloC family endoribonuclease [Cytophagales bacterium]|nr:YicC/YloC family endoribonuclease [Cytophagales bacterium]